VRAGPGKAAGLAGKMERERGLCTCAGGVIVAVWSRRCSVGRVLWSAPVAHATSFSLASPKKMLAWTRHRKPRVVPLTCLCMVTKCGCVA